MEILKFLGVNLEEKPSLDFIQEEKSVDIPDGSLCELLVTSVELPKGSKSPKEGLVVNFLVYGLANSETKFITYENGNVKFPNGKKGLYVNHRVTPDLFSRMNYIIRVNNTSHSVKLPDDYETYDDAKAAKFFLAVLSYRFGLDRYIAKGMIIPAFVYTNSRGFKDVSIYDRINRTYIPTPVPYRFLGGTQEEAERITDEIVSAYMTNGRTNGDASGIDESLKKMLGY